MADLGQDATLGILTYHCFLTIAIYLLKIAKVDLTLYLDLIYEQIFVIGDLVVYNCFAKGKCQKKG